MDFIPVDPALTDDGNFRSLAPFFPEKKCAPVPLGTVDNPTYAANINFFSCSASVAAKLGVSDLFSVSGGYMDRAAVADVTLGIPRYIVGNIPADQRVSATFWGVGLRIAMRIRTANAQASASFAVLSASVQLKRAQVQYQVSGLGLPVKLFVTALRGLPVFGSLDYESYAALGRIKNEFASTIKQSLKPDDLLPMGVLTTEDIISDDLMKESHSVRYAMLRIANRIPLAEAEASATSAIDSSVLRDVYAKTLPTGQSTPSDVASRRAKDWLEGLP